VTPVSNGTPTKATSTSSVVRTCGRRAKVAGPVNRGLWSESSGT